MAGGKLTLISGSFERIVSTLSDNLSVEVPAGIYQVRIDAPGYYQEEYIQVDSNKEFIVDVKRISAFPVSPFMSVHESHQNYARTYSMKCTAVPQSDVRPNFLFFMATYDLKTWGSSIPFREFTLFNDEGFTVRMKDSRCFFDEVTGVAVFSINIPPGLYFISYNPSPDADKDLSKDKENEQKKDRVIPFYIFEGKQSQFFIRCTSEPDFSNCRIFYSDRMEFDYNDKAYSTMERLLMAYSNYKYYESLTSEEKQCISQSTYLSALSAILHIALKKPLPTDLGPALELPDLEYLRSDSNDKEKIVALSERLPTLGFIMYKYSTNASGFVIAASLMDRVTEHAKYDIFWSNFTKVESRDLVARNIRKGIRDTSTFGKVRLMFESLVSATVNLDAIRTKTGSYSTGHGDESAIAQKLSIPLTSVIRNYKATKEAYDLILKKDKDLEENVFFKSLKKSYERKDSGSN
jgi:hypothetical protein